MLIKSRNEYQGADTIYRDIENAITGLPELARKLSGFRNLDQIEVRRDSSLDYFYTGDSGTMIVSTFIGDSQPSEEDINRFNKIIPGYIQSTLLLSGHYYIISVTL